jgi:Ca2+-binding RTX toxin-like protein
MTALAALLKSFQSKSHARAASRRARLRRANDNRRKFRVEPLEPRLLLSADLTGQAAALTAGLQGLSNWATTLNTAGVLAQPLPTYTQTANGPKTFETIGGAIDLGTLLATKLATPAKTYLSGGSPNLDGLVTALTAPGVTVSGSSSATEITLAVQLDASVAPTSSFLDLDNAANGIQARTSVDVGEHTKFNFTFGVDLTPGLSASEAFFIRAGADGLVLSADGHRASVPGFAGHVGFLDATFGDGTAGSKIDLDADVSVAFTNPTVNADGKITLSELQGTQLGNLVTLTPTSALNVTLPVKATLGSFAPTGTMTITDSNAFDGVTAAPSLSGFADMLKFNTVTNAQVLSLADEFGQWLNNFQTLDPLKFDVPFVSGESVSALDDFGTVFGTKLLSDAVGTGLKQQVKPADSNGQGEVLPDTPNFQSAQELATRLASALGLSAATIAADYNAATSELTYHLKLTTSANESAGLKVDVPDAGALHGVTSTSVPSLTEAGTLDFTFGINLSPLSGQNDSLERHLFVKNGALKGDVTMSVSSLTATGQFGLVDLTIAGGSGSGTATLIKNILDPSTLGSQVTFDTLLANLFHAPPNLTDAGSKTGSSHLDLLVTAAGPAAIVGALSGTPTITLTKATPDAAAAFSANSDFNPLLKFANLKASDIVAALTNADNYLAKIAALGALGAPVPVIGVSAADFLHLSDTLAATITGLQASPPHSLATVASSVSAALSAAGNTAVTAALVADGANALKLSLQFSSARSAKAPLSLDLAGLASIADQGTHAADDQVGLVDVSPAANQIDVDGTATSQLDLGIDLSNAAQPTPFIYDTSSLTLGLHVAENGLNLALASGPLQITVSGGNVLIDKDGPGGTSDPATFAVDVKDPGASPNGRITPDELALVNGPTDVGVTVTGQIHATLPVSFGNPVQNGTLALDINNLANELTHQANSVNFLGIPDFSSQLNTGAVANDLGVVGDGLDSLLKELQTALNSVVFGKNLPLVGDHLASLTTGVIDNFRNQFINAFKSALGNHPDETAVRSALAQVLQSIGVLGDTDGNTIVNDADVQVTDVAGLPEFKFLLNAPIFTASKNIGFALGLRGLGLKTDAQVQADLSFTWLVDFGVSLTDGFFLNTAAPNELDLKLSLTIPNAKASGDLAFLHLAIDDMGSHLTGDIAVDIKDPNNHLTLAEIASGPNFASLLSPMMDIQAKVDLNLNLSFGGVAELPSFNTEFVMQWDFNAASPETAASGPSVLAFKHVTLELGSFVSDFLGPIVRDIKKVFDPIKPVLDFLTDPIPVLSDIPGLKELLGDGTITPDPANGLEVLEIASRVLSIFGVPPEIFDVIAVIDKVNDIANLLSAPNPAGQLGIDLGTFDIAGALADQGGDARNAGGLDSLQITDPGFDPITKVKGFVDGALPANSILRQATDKLFTSAQRALKVGGAAFGGLGATPGGFDLRFPVLDDPTVLFGLLLGRDVNLMELDLAPFSLNTGTVNQSVPLLGPLSVGFFGSLNISGDFAFAYDTHGLVEFADTLVNTGKLHPELLADGFFVSDTGNPQGTGPDIPELTVSGAIGVKGELTAPVAALGAEGGIFANLSINLHDDDQDGKVRLSELAKEFDEGPLCIFDTSGDVHAGIHAYVKVGFDTPLGFVTIYEDGFDIANKVLLDLNHTCDNTIKLAEQSGGTLTLNMGSQTLRDKRGGGTQGEINESFSIRDFGTEDVNHNGSLDPGEDLNKNGALDSDVLEVSAFGQKQYFAGVTLIVANADDGNDSIVLDPNVMIAASLDGGSGDDTIVGGSANDTVSGGTGNDALSGGAGNDTINGQDGNDLIFGNAGADRLDGGSGDDRVYGGNGTDAVDNTGDLADTIFGGSGNDNLYGNFGDDVIWGGTGNDQLYGGLGNDTLAGGDNDDLIEGGLGADKIYGDADLDTTTLVVNDTTGYTGNDNLFGDARTPNPNQTDGGDFISGAGGVDLLVGDAGNDELHGGDGNDQLEGNSGNDKLYGENNDDLLSGGIGDDQVFGGAGNDTMFGDERIAVGAETALTAGQTDTDSMEGGAGNDTMYGGAGNDKMIGGSSTAAPGDADGNDSMFGDSGDDTLIGDNGIIDAVTLIGGAGNDYVGGGSGNDLIYGQGGNDTLEGGTGNDTMFGNAGDDVMRGQEDNDYMEGGSGNDTMLGGTGNDDMFGDASQVPAGLDGGTAGSDSMVGDAGDDWMLGDNGTIDRAAGTVITNPNGGAGIDTIYGGVGDDVIFGGGQGDVLVGDAADGTGNDLIVGDQGSRSPALDVAQTSAVAGSSGDDSIFGSGGDDSLLGGDGSDSITGDAGNDVIFGDNARITFVGGIIQRLFTTDPTHGGNDTITGSTGADTIFGGKGDDSISGAENADIIFGDNGVVVLNDGSAQANDLFTTDPNDGGRDSITGGAGDDIVFGGSGDGDLHGVGGDTLSGGSGNDIVIADNGYVTRDAANIVLRIETTLTNFGGDDIAFGNGGGSDTILGGFGDDSLVGGEQNDIIFGDNGVVVGNDGSAQANDLFSIAPDDGGKDTVDGAAGDDIIAGGTTDDTVGGGSGSDVILGDHAYITRNASNVLEDIKTAFENNGGSDLVLGSAGNDVLIGGHAGDTMYGDDATGSSGAADGEDIMLGDNGEIVLIGTTGSLLVQGAAVDSITATDTSEANGGADTMSGNAKADVILGGVNSDVIYGDLAATTAATIANDGDDILLGDNGTLDFTFLADSDRGSLDLIRTFRDGLGGGDTISGDRGADVIIGGNAGDTLYGDDANASSGASDGDDIMLGDNADVFFAGTTGRLLVRGTAVDLITTTDASETTGGADTMSGNAGADVVIGGVNADILYGDRAAPNATTIGNDGGDILLGDNGLLDFTLGSDTDRNTLDLIHSAQDGLGKADLISGNRGGDVAMGGTAGDTIYGDDAAASAGALDAGDVLLGDNADIFLVAKGAASGGDLRTILGSAIATIHTTDNVNASATGGSDTISGNGGGDIIAGGVFGDYLYGDRATPTAATAANDGNDIILGDNGALEWLSTGRLNEVTGIDIAANNPALFAKDGAGVADTDLTTLDLITTEQPTSGARDLIYGDEGKDFLFGGTDSDTMYGDDGNQTGAATNNDLMFGDHGRVYPQFSTLPGFNARNFFSIDVGIAAGGEGDQMWGEEGADVMLGEQGDDRMWGGSGDDDMIGGTNVAGGADELTAPAINATINPPVNDLMDGGSGNDAMAGDNAIIWRRADDFQARFEALTATTIYTTTSDTITANVRVNGALTPQSDPDDAVGRDITLLDHSFTVQNTLPERFGSDVMAGGADKDVMFGELGNDFMQGDGSIDGPSTTPVAPPNDASRAVTVTDSVLPSTQYYVFNVREQATDSDDYMEGNGGNDLMYGDLGQDDMIGGSSALYGLTTAAMRPDGSDIMFGGAGLHIGRNDLGDATIDQTGVITANTGGHARDADFMLGDNGNIFRLVKGGASASATDPNDVFRTFAYDTYAGSLRIIPRAMEELDYTLGGADYAGGSYHNGVANQDNGAADLMHGESGDDVIFGMTGSDMLFGEGQDDDIIGGYGNDWISGGTGQDGVIGDDGLIYTSRNGTAEPLNGIAATTQQTISTPGQIQYAVINVTGDLKKTIELVPFSFDHTWNATDDEFPDNADNTPFADDIIFGGLGSDFLHGGSGDDAISGAEALDHAWAPVYDANGNPTGIMDLGYAAASAWVPANPATNPGDVLAFNPLDLDGRHLNNRFRAGEFGLYDEYDPLREVQLDSTGNLWKSSAQGTAYDFVLNFNKDEGVLRPGGDVVKAVGQQTPTYGPVHDDGNDAIFGDNGNDWLVGGTGRDDMYGGWGNDLLNADDDQTTDGLLNDQPDTHPTYEDRAYGGAGRDVLIGNTGGDRLIDWVGEYNTYLVPYAPFGEASVSRTLQPQLQEYLYALSTADGADQTQARDTGSDPLRNGEPAGELGLVLQKDFAWQDQTGAPSDPQAGNIPGGKRDVLRSADFNNGQAQGFFADSGSWTVSGGRYQVAPTVNGGDAVSVFYVDGYVPTYFEMLATINAGKPTAGLNSNAYLVFDYQSATDFKFAGINVSTNKLEIGHRTAQGWVVDTQAVFPSSLRSSTDYNLFLSLNGSAVTLIVNNQVSLAFTFAPRVDAYGISHGLNDGMVGLGARNASAQIDNVTVQRLAPVTTFSQTVDFTSSTTSLFQAPLTGSWSLAGGRYAGTASATDPAIALTAINVTSSALIDLSAVLKTTGAGGFIYDEYSATDFKFVTISAGQVTLGHRTAKGWFTDATYSNPALTPDSTDYTLGLTLKGTAVSVTLNNQVVLSRTYNALVTDGDFGLFSRAGTTSFDTVTVKSDAPNLLNQAFALTADSAPTATGGPTSPLTEAHEAQLGDMAQAAIHDWSATLGAGAVSSTLSHVNFVLVNDLPGNALAWSIGDGIVLVDATAAGYGWFVDSTPDDSREYRTVGETVSALPGSNAAGRMDLLSVVAHELGHVLGFAHSDAVEDGVMTETLAAGERHLDGLVVTAPATTSLSRQTGRAADRATGPGDARPVVDWDGAIGTLLSGGMNAFGVEPAAKGGLKPSLPAFEYTGGDGQSAGRRSATSRNGVADDSTAPTAVLTPSLTWDWTVESVPGGTPSDADSVV